MEFLVFLGLILIIISFSVSSFNDLKTGGRKITKYKPSKDININCKFCNNSINFNTVNFDVLCSCCESRYVYNEKNPNYSVWYKSSKVKFLG